MMRPVTYEDINRWRGNRRRFGQSDWDRGHKHVNIILEQKNGEIILLHIGLDSSPHRICREIYKNSGNPDWDAYGNIWDIINKLCYFPPFEVADFSLDEIELAQDLITQMG